MNPSVIPSEQEVEANWVTGNWNRQDSVTGPDICRPVSGKRVDWDWDNSMILAQHSGGGSNDNDADRKSSVSRSLASNVCAYTCILSSGFPSNFSQNPRGIFHSPGIRSFSSMGSTSITTSSVLDGWPRSANITGIPGLAPTSADHGDVRSLFGERRRQYFGPMSSENKGQMNDFTVKRETEVSGSDGNGARIGLNLGVRTYFSTEDTAAGRLGKRHRAQSPGSQVPICQAEGCKSDLRIAKHYHRRHKVCELHSKAANVVAAGFTQRFCQQCSRFHLLSEFDEGKRSCRKRLADHNRRRRKPQPPTGCAGGRPCSALIGKNDEHLSCMFVSTEPKSTLKRLKKSGSRSSASLDDSDELTGSAETTFHIHTCAALDIPNAIGPYSQPYSTPLSDAQTLVSALSTAAAPPVLCMHQNVKHHLSGFSENSQETAVYNQFLNRRSGHGDPNLSFASLGGMRFGSKVEQNSGQNYHRVDHPVPWLRPSGTLSDSHETLSRPRSLQPLILGMKPVGSNEENASASSLSSGLEYSTPAQSCLPAVLSRDVSGSEWIIGNQDNCDQFGPTSLNIMSRGHGEGRQFGLETSGAPLAGALGGQQRGLGILSLHGSEGLDDSHTDGHDLKFPDLQLLRPGNFAPSVYDSDNIL